MRINAFVTFDPLFQELDSILEHESVADIVEDQTNGLFSFPLQNINVLTARLYGQSIESGQLSEITESLFQTAGKNEVNYGLRIMNNGLAPTKIITVFKETMPAGSRLFLVKKSDMSSVVQYHQDEYTALTGSLDRKDIAKRNRLYCGPLETLTNENISTAVYNTLNFVDTYFSSINATPYTNFDRDLYLNGSATTVSGLVCRVYTA